MMNFEERKAEIFRRSDERIKIRKRNRKRILLSCMSLIIFVSVISAVAVYPLTRMQDKSNSNWSENHAGSIHFSVEITNDQTGYHETIKEPERATAAAEILIQYTPDDVSINNYSTGNPAEDQRKEAKDDVYEIAIHTGSEQKMLFALSGNTLISIDTQTEYQLTDTELEELLTALGLAD